MQIKLSVALLALVPLLAAASPTPAEPVVKLPMKRRSFTQESGAVDIPALQAHVDEVRT